MTKLGFGEAQYAACIEGIGLALNGKVMVAKRNRYESLGGHTESFSWGFLLQAGDCIQVHTQVPKYSSNKYPISTQVLIQSVPKYSSSL